MEEHPYLSNRFIVLMGPLVTSFQKISGIENVVEYDTYHEGGVNSYPHVFVKQKQEPSKLTFEKGYGIMNPLSKLSGFRRELIQEITPGTILLLDEKSSIVRMFAFIGAMPVEWRMSELNAQASELLIDTITIIHKGIKEVPVVF